MKIFTAASTGRMSLRALLFRATIAFPLAVRAVGAQTDSGSIDRRYSLLTVTADEIDRARFDQLVNGVGPGQSLLLRSVSSLNPPVAQEGRGLRAIPIAPQFLFVSNTALPFSQNDGAMWAGRGLSSRTLLGFRLESSRFRLIFAPEIISSANSDWILRHNPPYRAPAIPPDRSGGGFVFPFYVASAWSIDQPMRFGDKPIRRFDPGQSTAMWSTSSLQLGVSNENEWWGPGIRNAIVLSNNAPGFPHLFIRTAHPLSTRFGLVESRWLVGGLTESKFFDTVSTNNVRSLASVAATLQTAWDPNLSFGVARSVYSTATGWGQVPWRWLDVLSRTADTGNATPQDPSGKIRKDQLFSLFARWVAPADGLEIYTEWARTQLRLNLHDLLVRPNHTQAYTLGLQWRRPAWWGGAFRLQTEITQMEQSATFRDLPQESWYMSTRVIQGYTNRGEVIGGSIGPGASSQWLAMDYVRQSWRFGGYLGRIRWNEDVHSTANFPVYQGYCNHDVTLYPGVRAASISRLGTLTADVAFQNRENAFFENDGGCPNVGIRRDIRNRSLSITFSPFDAH